MTPIQRARAALLLIWPRGLECEHQHARDAFAALDAAEVTGWDMTSRIAVAIGCKPPPDDDGFWALPNGNIIHHDDLMVELADLVREVMDAELTARVAPVGPLTLEAAP